MKSKGGQEAEISQAIIRFEKDSMGRGPLERKTYLIDDLVFVRLQGVMTPAEHKLAQAEEGPRGRGLIKEARQRLLEHGRPLLRGRCRSREQSAGKAIRTSEGSRGGAER